MRKTVKPFSEQVAELKACFSGWQQLENAEYCSEHGFFYIEIDYSTETIKYRGSPAIKAKTIFDKCFYTAYELSLRDAGTGRHEQRLEVARYQKENNIDMML